MRISEIIRALRGAAADELSAQNLYAEIIDCLKESGYKDEKGVINRLEEIMHDEEMHLGNLLYIVSQIDGSIAVNMEKGAEGD